MRLLQVTATLAAVVSAAVIGLEERQDDSPSDAPFPSSTYPNAVDPAAEAGAQSGETSPPYYPSPWGEGLGDWGAAYQKARAFVSQLTLLEKVNLTTGVGWEGESCVGNTGSIPRLGFRSLCLEDSPLGVRNTDYNSAFPAGGTIAQSWDRNVWYQRGYAMGSEHRDKGVDAQLGPVVGPLGRAPEGGRNWEGFSPDPVLSGIAVAQSIYGIQDAGVMATTKHYIGYEQEHFRQAPEAQGYGFNITESISSNIDDITMHELYLWPFADAVRAGTASIMCSYNQINNSYAGQNAYALNYLLKRELGFQGFVMSDWAAQHAGVASALAGLDMTMPGDTSFDSGLSFWGANLTLAVINGTVPEWRIDDMAVRIMAAFYYVGRDQHQVPVNFNAWTLNTYGYQHPIAMTGYGVVNQHVDVRDNHSAIIRDGAAKSNILLKNTGSLPLTGKERFTAIIGEDAVVNPYGPNGCSDRGCDNGTLAMGWGSGTANFPYLVSPAEAIKNKVLSNGNEVQEVYDNWAEAQIAATASQATVAIVFVNSDSGEGYISVDGNEGDRNNLTLWKNGETIIANTTAVCNNTIVVVHSVGPLLIGDWVNNPNITGVIWAGLPGEQSGNSLVDVLYGAVNPGGKLVFTLGKTREDYGTDLLYKPNNGMAAPQQDFTEGQFIDYRYFDKAGIEPVFEFGFGLSYTTFSYSNLQVTSNGNPAYTPTTGFTSAAPVLGNFSTNLADYQFPSGFVAVKDYIYPYLNSTNAATASMDPSYGQPNSQVLPPNAQNGNPQPLVPAGGAPGGNPALYDVLFTVTADIENTGSVEGDEVVQLYVSRGGPNDPVRELRNFDRITIAPGQTQQFTANITRRDISNWDPASQDWIITQYTKTVYVGASSRKLYLNATLNLSGTSTSGGGSGGGSNSSSSAANSASSAASSSNAGSGAGGQSTSSAAAAASSTTCTTSAAAQNTSSAAAESNTSASAAPPTTASAAASSSNNNYGATTAAAASGSTESCSTSMN